MNNKNFFSFSTEKFGEKNLYFRILKICENHVMNSIIVREETILWLTKDKIEDNEKRITEAGDPELVGSGQSVGGIVFFFFLKIIKGQLISKCPYEKSVLSKIPTKKFPRFLS